MIFLQEVHHWVAMEPRLVFLQPLSSMSMQSLVQELLLQEMHSPVLLKVQWGPNHLR